MSYPPAPPPMAYPVMPAPNNDVSHLKTLSVLHYVFGGLGTVGFVFIGLHFALVRWMVMNPQFQKNQQPGGPPPEVFLGMMVGIYGFVALLLTAGIVLNVLSARFIARRRNRMFSLVVAGLDCAQFPLGTTLGVFTFIVLLRDSVRRLYDEQKPPH